MTILDEIIAYKKKEVQERKSVCSVKQLEQTDLFPGKVIPLTDYLTDKNKTGIITEFKRKSPSKGVINDTADIEEVTKGYAVAGASGLSILTDKKYFGGSDADLIKARKVNNIPILRKEFMVDEYQVVEAKSIGADVILLIAAALDVNEVNHLSRLARALGLQVLLEIHNEKELAHINDYVNIVGVNNRDLKDFTVDLHRSEILSDRIPQDFVKISESGIHSPEDINLLKKAGFQGFLIGENFMKEKNPAKAFKDFILSMKK